MTDQYCICIVQSSRNFNHCSHTQKSHIYQGKSNFVISLVSLIKIIIIILYGFVFCVIQEYIALALTILDSYSSSNIYLVSHSKPSNII